MLVAFDTETNGLDLFHSARPYFATLAYEDGSQVHYEWPVDPLTRQVLRDEGDIVELRQRLTSADRIVGQNIGFDVKALQQAGILEDWPWDKTEDTLLASHLLASNQPHDLTALALQYLGEDIESWEQRLEKAVKECRRKVQQARLRCKRLRNRKALALAVGLAPNTPEPMVRDFYLEHGIPLLDPNGEEDHPEDVYATWRISEQGDPDNPSTKEKSWKHDAWLPRAMAIHDELPPPEEGCVHRWGDDWLCTRCLGHRYWLVLQEYANVDSAVTLPLWRVLEQRIRSRGLWRIYEESKRLQPIVNDMEVHGVTINSKALDNLRREYIDAAERDGRICVNLASSIGYDLQLPMSGNNGSLDVFCFGEPEVDQDGKRDRRQRRHRSDCLMLPILGRTETGCPSLDKRVIEEYLATLPAGSVQLAFITALSRKRRRDISVNFLDQYERFWLSLRSRDGRRVVGWYLLHPSLNQTGTDTLRFSSNNPNSQNIAKLPDEHGLTLRSCFGPAPGREWWSMDAKNIELRLPAYLSGERELIDLFERPNDPPYFGSTHLLNFHTVYRDLWERELRDIPGAFCQVCERVHEDGHTEVGAHIKKKYEASWYKWCKNGGFAKQYGGQKATVDRAFHRQGAYDLITARFSRLEKLNQECIRKAERLGYVETIPDLTVDPSRGYPLMCGRTERGGVQPTLPLNYVIQGSAMWWTRKAMARCHARLGEWRRQEKFDGRICLQVHDELVFDLPRRGDPLAERDGRVRPGSSNLGRAMELRQLMEMGGEDYGIPTPVGCEYHSESWAKGTTL